jgi:hypothetical protein
MIGKDNEEEEVHYKVADKRKFNSDGSLRDGVTLEPAKVEPPTAPSEPANTEADPKLVAETTPPEQAIDDEAPYIDDSDGEEIPGINDPASFVNFLSMLATNAATALGGVPHPSTGQRSLDLEGGKYWLDVLGMIKDKTVGNLHPKENRLLDGLLADMRLQYVQLVRATEEKLKAQAAQKLSGADILGKK